MIDENTLRSELVKQPRPARIVVRNEDDDVVEVKIPNGKGGTTWASVARTIVAMSPKLVELYDPDGAMLRALNAQTSTLEKAPPGANLPPIVTQLPTDPETARMVHVANLIAEAYKFSTGVAFDKLVAIVERQADRAERTDARLERVEAQYRREVRDQIESARDELEEMREAAQRGDAAGARDIFEGFMSSFMQGRAEQNGKGSGS